MENLKKILNCAFKSHILLLVFFVVSCKNKNISTSSGYESTTVSYYANQFEGNKTASGDTYKHSKMTGAHKSLSFGTLVEVINIENDKSVTIMINDRGSLKPSREFDLSQGVFKKIADLREGVVKVKYRILK